MGKANRRLKKPSSYIRLVSRVPVYDIAWGALSPLPAFLLRDGTIYSPGVVATYCAAALLASLAVFQWFQTASPIVHFGGVCESGVTCTGNRDLYDDFGVAASPTTGLASIIYSDDQFHSGAPNSSGCDASTSNSGTCDHTAIATQTSGSGIFAVATKKK